MDPLAIISSPLARVDATVTEGDPQLTLSVEEEKATIHLGVSLPEQLQWTCLQL